jgi:RimJ/RimL family protein N-acetyltransferase
MHYTFDLSKEYILEDDCVLLRPLKHDDCGNLQYFSRNEPEIWTYSSQKAAGDENLKKYIEFAINARTTGTEYPFIVFDKKQQSYAGSTRYYDIQLQHLTLQLGFTWYGKAFQGTGLNKRCKLLLLQFAFEQMGMERVEFRADHNNARSIAAMKSIGCTVEGVLRSHTIKADGGRRDSIVLSILRQEWFDHVKENLRKKIADG